jgi:hypothetical protein
MGNNATSWFNYALDFFLFEYSIKAAPAKTKRRIILAIKEYNSPFL